MLFYQVWLIINCSTRVFIFLGIQYFTIGQRAHLGGLDKAYFVAHRCPETQDILVVSFTILPCIPHIAIIIHVVL